jgi:hypothetical protein
MAPSTHCYDVCSGYDMTHREPTKASAALHQTLQVAFGLNTAKRSNDAGRWWVVGVGQTLRDRISVGWEGLCTPGKALPVPVALLPQLFVVNFTPTWYSVKPGKKCIFLVSRVRN